jgi:hypothetical protein
MPNLTVNPTANSTPDVGQGGISVTGNSNTGHDSTVTATANALVTKSCIWTGFPSVGGVASARLKFDWTEAGTVNEGTGFATNEFRIQYSLNGGGVWNTAILHNDVIAPNSGSFDLLLNLPQDISQVQVRDRMQAEASADISDSANITTTVSNIRIEVVTRSAKILGAF